MRYVVVFLFVFFGTHPVFGWSEAGHHLIALMACELLSEQEQQQVRSIIAGHPRFSQDFIVPKILTNPQAIQEWTIGRAAFWPDIAANQPNFNRPNWHYQPGAIMKFGADIPIPKTPGPLPKDATLNTGDLYITQAVELCRRVLRDKSQPAADHALALCWLFHLVGDCHQPCHAGSLYMVIVFPQGDQWANSIPTKQGGNLHRLWDGLLGATYDPAEVRRRADEIQTNESLWIHANDVATGLSGLNPTTWLAESKEHGKDDVYAKEVMSAVEEAMSRSLKVTTLNLSDDYLKNAGVVARKRAAFAAHRLALILRESL